MKSMILVCFLFVTFAYGQEVQSGSKYYLKATEVEVKGARCAQESKCDLQIEMFAYNQKKSRPYVALVYADPVQGRDRITMNAENSEKLNDGAIKRINKEGSSTLEIKVLNLDNGGSSEILAKQDFSFDRNDLLNGNGKIQEKTMPCAQSEVCAEVNVKFEIYIQQ